MVSVEVASAVEPAQINQFRNMNNCSPSSSPPDTVKSTEELTLDIPCPVSQAAENPKQSIPLEGVCQTAGFINSQSHKVEKFPGNVRFVVQPVTEDEIRQVSDDSQDNENNQSSMQSFTFLGVQHSSADDINSYSIYII